MVFCNLDPKSLLITVPSICKFWRQTCQEMRNAEIHFAWWDAVLPAEAVVTTSRLFRFSSSAKFDQKLKIQDNHVTSMTRCCSGIKTVDFTSCNLLTDAAVIASAQGCKDITSVDFASCTLLTDAAVIALAQNCSGITRVDFFECDDLTNTVVIALAQSCIGMTSVRYGMWDNLTDAAVIAIAENCSSITDFDFHRSEALTDAASIALAQGCIRIGTCQLRLLLQPHIHRGYCLGARLQCDHMLWDFRL